jgi:hypothetical protein
MRHLVARLLFIQYCIVAGVLLITVPWTQGLWERITLQIGYFPLIEMALSPLARGAVTGFGLVHLVWGAHDLYELLFGEEQDHEDDAATAGHHRS